MLVLTPRPGMMIGIEAPNGDVIYVQFLPRPHHKQVGVEAPKAYKVFRVRPGMTPEEEEAERRRRIIDRWANARRVEEARKAAALEAQEAEPVL